MYVLSASNRRVSVQLLGKDKIQDKLSRFEELTGASLSYLGVSSSGPPCQISATVPSKFPIPLNLLKKLFDPIAWHPYIINFDGLFTISFFFSITRKLKMQ